jgi:ABC-2 type transport system permease protein
MKYISIFIAQLKNNFVREAIYRTNLFTMFFVDLIWIGVEISLFGVIYANTPNLAGWTQPQVYFFLGIFFASDALFTVFFQRNFWNFSDLVNRGELDILLTKPASPIFLALTRWMGITSGLNFFLGIGIAVHFSEPAGFAGGWRWFLLPMWLLIGNLTQLLLRFAFSVWIFWSERSFAISRMYYQFFSLATKPDSLYPGFIRYVILTFLPFAFIGSVPARALIHGLTLREVGSMIVILGGFFLFNRFFWIKGLARYQSASS